MRPPGKDCDGKSSRTMRFREPPEGARAARGSWMKNIPELPTESEMQVDSDACGALQPPGMFVPEKAA